MNKTVTVRFEVLLCLYRPEKVSAGFGKRDAGEYSSFNFTTLGNSLADVPLRVGENIRRGDKSLELSPTIESHHILGTVLLEPLLNNLTHKIVEGVMSTLLIQFTCFAPRLVVETEIP